MRILFAGNTANVGYLNCKYFRKFGISTDLLIESNPSDTKNPIKTDLSLNGKYPNWIRFYHRGRFGWKSILKILRDKKYDIIISHYNLIIFSYFSRKIFIPQVLGSDIRELAFSNSIRGMLMKRALKKAKIIFFAHPDDKLSLEKLNIHSGIFIPIMWDTDYFKPDDSKSTDNSHLTIFHPTNLNWKIKGNNILIKGFAEFVKTSPNSILIIVDRGIDSENTHKLVKKLELENKIKFIKGPLNYEELKKQYLLSDIVADQFIFPGLGGIACESLACGKPILTNSPIGTYQDLHDEEPPIIHCKNSDDILKNLQILKDEKLRKNIGLKGREWVVKYHSPKSIISKINSIFEMILEKKMEKTL